MEQARPQINLQPVYFTFDDGPKQPYTSQILEALKEHKSKATFFVCGENAQKNPEIVKAIFNSGHALGNHSFSHGWIKSYSGLLKNEIIKTDEAIYSILGIRPYLFRPPWGITTPWLKKYVADSGRKLVLWDILAFDWWNPPPSFMAERILKRLKPKSIVLLHDGNRTLQSGDRTNTVKAFKMILDKLPALGLYADKIV